ncbi:MAG: aminotransferase class IV [Microbacter sp.]
MFRFIETIRVENKAFLHLELHEERLNRTRRAFFGNVPFINLKELIQLPESLNQSIYKCRIVYGSSIELVTFEPYMIKKIDSLQLIMDDAIDYSFKYEDRSRLNQHLKHTTADDIIVVKNGFITDTSFSNITFFDGRKWLTPTTYLLNGTQRSRLLQQNAMIEAEIRPSDLKHFKFVKLINAMLDLETSPLIDIQVIK